MKKNPELAGICIPVIALLFFSCSLTQKHDPANAATRKYLLHLDPRAGDTYEYTITNESNTHFEIEEKEMEFNNNSEVTMQYIILTDSNEYKRFRSSYKSIILKTSNGEGNTETRVDDKTVPFSPMEKMLKILRDASFDIAFSTTGEVKDMRGIDSLEDRLVALFAGEGEAVQQQVRSQWKTVIKERMVKQNLDQLFRLFPDSLVKQGDTWKLTSREEGPMRLQVTGNYQLKALNEALAIIDVEGKVKSDNEPAFVTGQQPAKMDIGGEQSGQFELETETGMLLNCRMKIKMTGTMEVMGRLVPVSITTSITVKGKRVP